MHGVKVLLHAKGASAANRVCGPKHNRPARQPIAATGCKLQARQLGIGTCRSLCSRVMTLRNVRQRLRDELTCTQIQDNRYLTSADHADFKYLAQASRLWPQLLQPCLVPNLQQSMQAGDPPLS